MTPILMFINALIAITLIIIILLQRSDPASGGAFGGMGNAGQPSMRNPLAKPTAILAAVFLVNCLVMAYASKGATSHTSVMEAEDNVTPGIPALPEPTLQPALAPAVLPANVGVSASVPANQPASPSVPPSAP
jgi:preprotein translocase subunit SecG